MRREVRLDPAVAAILSGDGARPEPESRRRVVRPHELNRRGRKLSVTLPSAEWRDAVADRAERLGLRNSDFVTWCIAVAMAAGEGGEVDWPRGHPGYQERADEVVELPWGPG